MAKAQSKKEEKPIGYKVSKIMMWPSRKINLGNYSTADLNAGLEIVFDTPVDINGTEVQEAFTTARKVIKQEFIKQFAPFAPKKKEDKPPTDK